MLKAFLCWLAMFSQEPEKLPAVRPYPQFPSWVKIEDRRFRVRERIEDLWLRKPFTDEHIRQLQEWDDMAGQLLVLQGGIAANEYILHAEAVVKAHLGEEGFRWGFSFGPGNDD